MAEPLTTTLNWNVIEGAGLATGAILRRFRRSGLSVAFHGGRVGAIGLDFFSARHDPKPVCADWSYVLKIANPGTRTVSIERITSTWRGGWSFYAGTSDSVIKMIHPKPSLPDDGDKSLPLLIASGETAMFQVECLLFLYKKYGWYKKLTAYSKQSYPHTHPNKLRYTVKIKTNLGQTTLKS